MNARFQKLIKPIILGAVLIFGVCWLIKKPESVEDYWSYISYSISGIGILFMLYERVLWKVIPWNRPPILKKHYAGEITYASKKEVLTKSIAVTVKQTLFSVRIKTKTDINASSSVVGSIVEEFGDNILYYTYITNPSAILHNTNPIHRGTCRMVLTEKCDSIEGKYWTSSKTAGDIRWTVDRQTHT